MTEYELLCSRAGKPQADRLVRLGLIDLPQQVQWADRVHDGTVKCQTVSEQVALSEDHQVVPDEKLVLTRKNEVTPSELQRQSFERSNGELGSMGRCYTAISLFSGAMGLDLGLKQTGRFRLLACVEKEQAFCDTIRVNKSSGRLDPGIVIFQADMARLDPREVLDAAGLKPGELDVLIGGPPCQSFSTAGRRGTVEDPRGTLLWDFLRFVDYMKPRMFLMENVRGLLSAALRHRPIAKRPERSGAALEPDEEPGSVVQLLAEDLQKIDGCRYHMDWLRGKRRQLWCAPTS